MFNEEIENVFILGAGFSRNAGLPVADGVSQKLFDPRLQSALDIIISTAIQEFLIRSFSWKSKDPIPSFEDLFTTIDLAAGSGHSIGRRFTPKRLRAVRRFLIYRIFQVLDLDYQESAEIRELLEQNCDNPNKSHFVVLNWDIVLEKHIYGFADGWVKYCADITPWMGANRPSAPRTAAIAKVHGSSNWVYCDSCRSLFYEQHGKLSLTVLAGIQKSDLRLFVPDMTDSTFNDLMPISAKMRSCPHCNCAVGPHIATFSYKKSFRTHAFASAWLSAEQMLTQAKNWVFIGYSMPAADFEFKHLLKTCELKGMSNSAYPKRITAVVKDDQSAEDRFRRFFGADNVKVLQGGLAEFLEP